MKTIYILFAINAKNVIKILILIYIAIYVIKIIIDLYIKKM